MPLGHDIYGLDIETDTGAGSIDPAETRIRAIGLSVRNADRTFTGDEATILRQVDEALADLPGGILATWNGATFDLPFISDRARLLGVALDLTLCSDRRRRTTRALLPGHDGAYRATWGAHRHLDTFRIYGDSGSTGTFSAIFGFPRRRAATIASTDDLLHEAMHAHAASDARLARVLAERKGAGVLRYVDQVSEDEDRIGLDLAAAGQSAEDRMPVESVRVRPAVAGIA
ncbi:MAG: hypothetical protein KDB02_07355 [Acidimicrobiales bacterium]|nr:hypothetical protein [Acidimicrobiales bacterium]